MLEVAPAGSSEDTRAGNEAGAEVPAFAWDWQVEGRSRLLSWLFQGVCVVINIYVGNLPFRAAEEDVRELFEAHGEVSSVALIKDRETGRPRGFGFVEMTSKAAGEAAIDALNGQQFEGRTLTVNEARPRERRPARAGGGGDRRY